MNNKLPISCFVIAQDEADRIANTIESVIDFVDEVIVIDSGSTDGSSMNADGDMVVLQFDTLTINASVTLTTQHPCRGMFIYVKNNSSVVAVLYS